MRKSLTRPISAFPCHITFGLCFSHEDLFNNSLSLYMLAPSPLAFCSLAFGLHITLSWNRCSVLSVSYSLWCCFFLECKPWYSYYMHQCLNKNETVYSDFFEINNCVFPISKFSPWNNAHCQKLSVKYEIHLKRNSNRLQYSAQDRLKKPC